MWRLWRLAAFAVCRISAFIVKLLRRPKKKRRAFGIAFAGVVR